MLYIYIYVYTYNTYSVYVLVMCYVNAYSGIEACAEARGRDSGDASNSKLDEELTRLARD